MSWNTIESDAGIFTQLVRDLGVSGVQFAEIPMLDSLEELAPSLYGAIFLFKYNSSDYSGNGPMQGAYNFDYPDSLFFANQTIQNACGTLAVLNTLLSLSSEFPEEIRLGDTLSEFTSFTSAFKDPVLRGESISNSDHIRNVHNSFSTPDPFVLDEKTPDDGRKAAEVFHFVSFMEHEGILYELDGLQPAPIVHCEYSNVSQDKLTFAQNIVSLLQNRMQLCMNSGGKFSVIAIHRDAIERLEELHHQGAITDQDYQYEYSKELQKREMWGKELSMRRQNLYGLVFELLKQISSSMTEEEFANHIERAQKTTLKRLKRRN
ncbi:LAQU0S19e01640g1_1 [Lachancea quebecensis]|uniref:Ubiquitin carboxyl-terminal hydrolase n=1 Tax=Lachancea quebecensis TaxID=1654605 RepID=A0A0P1KXM6_9SACH|nr:LAQU0S19e01640g1_1 [Lachancea quebecensis]